MACCGGSSDEDKKNAEINKILRDDRKRLEKEIKLLLLGAGESGKSTIAKQMKIIHLNGFSGEERTGYKSIIYNNTMAAMKALILGAAQLGIPLGNDVQAIAAKIANDDDEYFDGVITPEIAVDIKALYKNEGIQKAFERQAEFQLIDSAQYYIEAVERLADPNYLPSEQDVLRARAKTTGIIETNFSVEDLSFKLVDVGGQRSERKKWMHCFQDVTAVIFCVAMSEYDLKLYEDDTTNRMHESLKLFREICNTKWFLNTSMILFLNKSDLFSEKIKKVSITVCFPEYKGISDATNAGKYITDQFLAQNDNPEKSVYPHPTCATDTNNIQIVFNAVKDIILQESLKNAGIGM